MVLKVNFDRMLEMSMAIWRLDRGIEEGVLSVLGRDKEVERLLDDTSRAYSEPYVQAEIHRARMLLHEIQQLSNSIHEQLSAKHKELIDGMTKYEDTEYKTIQMINRLQSSNPLPSQIQWVKFPGQPLVGQTSSVNHYAENDSNPAVEEDTEENPLMIVDPEQVHVNNLKMLIAGYLRDKGYQLYEGDIYSGTMMEVVDFRKYAFEQGYNPDTFEYILPQDRSSAYLKYNDRYFEKMREYPEVVEEHYTKPFKNKLKKSLLQAASDIVDNIPVIGTIKGMEEVKSGVNPVTGEQLSGVDRTITGVSIGASLFPFGRLVVKGGSKVVKGTVKVADNLIDDIPDLWKGRSGSRDAQRPMSGEDWDADFKTKYGEDSVEWVSKESRAARERAVEILNRVMEHIGISKTIREMKKEASQFDEYLAQEKKILDSTKQRNIEGMPKVNPLKVNNEALDHANLGDFTRNPKTGEISKMSGGGHGQDNIAFLEKNGIEYNIELTYPNGVRVGNVPGHKSKGKRTGTGQAWFPETWTKEDISKAGEYVANIPDHVNVADGVTIFGEYKGVRVGVIKTNGEIGTIFPDNMMQP